MLDAPARALVIVVTAVALLVVVRNVPPGAAAAAAVQADMAFDPEAATEAYLEKIPRDLRARSDAYFEGGYWLLLWNFLVNAGISLGLLHWGLSARLRDLTARLSRRVSLRPAVYWIGFLMLTSALAFPLTVYQGYFRERQYGLATQTLGAWMGDWAKTLGVTAVLGAILMIPLYAVLRRAGSRAWLWASGVTVVFLAFVLAIGPVYIAPLFNTYTPLRDAAVRESILQMARANGVQADEVYEVDASRQTTRISANVSGMLGTDRITLNDNLLARASPAAVRAVMGHEIGHYVLNHTYELLLELSLIMAAGFALVAWAYPRLSRLRAARWGVGGLADPAGLPLIVLLLGAYFFVLTPVVNTVIRSNESEADVFGLNASREADGFAEAAALLAEYRKMDPGPIEELLFFDHPSGRTRILTAMRWKAVTGVSAGSATATPRAASTGGS